MISPRTPKPPKSRFIGVDVFKGFGVWYMFIIHAFIQQIAGYDGSLFVNTLTHIGSWWPYIFALPIGIVSLWGFMFGFAFACTVALQTMRIIDTNPKRLAKYIWHKLIMGVLLLILNQIGNNLFRLQFDGSIIFPALRVSYNANILDAIAWMGVLVPIIMWLIYRVFRIKKTNQLVFVFIIILTFWFVLSPTLITHGESAIDWLNARNLNIISLFITKFTRGRFRLLPGLGYGFIGSAYAVLLYKQVDFKYIIRFTLIFFAYCVLACGAWLMADYFVDNVLDAFQNFTDETVPIPLTIVAMSTMQFLFVLFIRTHDYPKSEIKRVRASKRTTFWRRFSIFSLTGFSIGTPIADGIFSFFIRFMGPSVDYGGGAGVFSWNLWQMLTFIFFIWGFWEIILRIWENFEYKFSLDWFLAQIMAMLTGKKMNRSQVRPIIYGPNHYQVKQIPILIKQKVKAFN